MAQQPPSALGTLERKTLLYRSRLGFDCINHVQGCAHGCRYPCHAFLIFSRHGRVGSYAEWCQPRLVANAPQLLDRELTHRRRLPDRVHLCLSTDPFMVGYPEVASLSLTLIKRLNDSDIGVSVLTKGVLPDALGNSGYYSQRNEYGISLVSLDEGFRRRWEPGAAPYAERIQALERLHRSGNSTRVHIEPYPTPDVIEQDIEKLLASVRFVDRLFFGGWNYNRQVGGDARATRFYRERAGVVRRFCERNNIECELG